MLLERDAEIAALRDLVAAIADGRGSTVLLEAPAGRLLRGDAGDTGFAILHGLYWVAARLAARAPLLLIVDDAQWADEPSLRFLLYLLGRLESAPLGVLAAARPSENPLLAQLAGDPEVTVRERAPLGCDAVAALVGPQRARHRAWTGPIDAAIADARDAIEVFRGADVLYVPTAGAALVRALLDRDEPEEAAAALALMDAHIVAPGFFAAWRHDAAARPHAYRGEREQARAAWLACGEFAMGILASNPAIWPWRSGAALAMGGGPEAISLAGEELALAERFGAPRAIGVAHRALGVLTGDPAHHQAAVDRGGATPGSPRAPHARRAPRGRAGRRRPQQPRDRRRALRQREVGRVAPRQRLPQARHPGTLGTAALRGTVLRDIHIASA